MWRFIEEPIYARGTIFIRETTDESFIVQDIEYHMHYGVVYKLYCTPGGCSTAAKHVEYMTEDEIKKLSVVK